MAFLATASKKSKATSVQLPTAFESAMERTMQLVRKPDGAVPEASYSAIRMHLLRVVIERKLQCTDCPRCSAGTEAPVQLAHATITSSIHTHPGIQNDFDALYTRSPTNLHMKPFPLARSKQHTWFSGTGTQNLNHDSHRSLGLQAGQCQSASDCNSTLPPVTKATDTEMATPASPASNLMAGMNTNFATTLQWMRFFLY